MDKRTRLTRKIVYEIRRSRPELGQSVEPQRPFRVSRPCCPTRHSVPNQLWVSALGLMRIYEFPDRREVVVVMLRGEIEMVHQPHRFFKPRVQPGVPE